VGFRASLHVEDLIGDIGWEPGTDRFASVQREERDRFAPRLRGNRDWAVASTCTELVCSPPVIWDANGYYRAHGFSWPYRGITRRDLRQAHHQRGIEDRWLTYALKQLCDPRIRRAYDATPLGEPFLDAYVQFWLKSQAAGKASRESERAGEVITPEDVLSDLGYDIDPAQDLSSTPPVEDPETGGTVSAPWTWAYYQHRSTCDDSDRLGRWQEMLVKAFARVGTRRRFAVGFVGRQAHQWVAGEVHGHLVVFLNDRIEPTSELAAIAVASIIDEGA
jgi:hypothetical protein